MKKQRAILWAAAAVTLLGVFGFLVLESLAAYRSRYSMSVITPYHVGPPTASERVFIATQGSEFKYALVERVVEYLTRRGAYVQVSDVSDLSKVQEAEWSAILVVHTWENWQPQHDAKSFIDRTRNRNKVVVVTTSGSGREKMPGVDVISAASELRDVPSTVAQMTKRLDGVLQERPASIP